MVADWTQPRLWLDRVEAAIHGCANIGGVLHHPVESGGPPPRGARTGPAPCLLEPAADLAQAQAVEPNPGKDQAHKARLLGHDLEPGDSATPGAGDIAIPIRSAGEGAHRAGLRGMAPSPPTSLQDLGALVFGDDPLDLEQQVVLRASADRAVEEGDLNAGAPELLHQQSLVRMTPGEPVWSEQVDAVDVPGGHCVAQPLQGWPHQGGSAVPRVDIGVVRSACGPIGHDPLAQGGDLAGNRMVTRLGGCVARIEAAGAMPPTPLGVR